MNRKWATLFVVILVALIGVADWRTGYEISFFVFYFLPVCMAAWFLGLAGAITTSVLCRIVWATADLNSGRSYSSDAYAVWNAVVRLISFLAIGALGWLVSRLRRSLDREQASSVALRQTLSRVKVLESFLTICAQCKKIRNKEGIWEPLEVYVGQHSATRFSHGYCPQCARDAMRSMDEGTTDTQARMTRRHDHGRHSGNRGGRTT